MSDMNPDGPRSEEDRYFYEKEQEFLEEQRRADKLKADRAAMGTVVGIDDEEVLKKLQNLGYDAEIVPLLPILPLLQVAWSEGNVTGRERTAILEVAQSRGIVAGGRAFAQLESWLETQPADPMFTQSINLLGKILRERNPEASAVTLREIIDVCTKVAAASGGFFGFGNNVSEVEQGVIDRINAALQNDSQP